MLIIAYDRPEKELTVVNNSGVLVVYTEVDACVYERLLGYSGEGDQSSAYNSLEKKRSLLLTYEC